jgi:hypothetical protein
MIVFRTQPHNAYSAVSSFLFLDLDLDLEFTVPGTAKPLNSRLQLSQRRL